MPEEMMVLMGMLCSPQSGTGKGQGSHVATGKGNGGTQHASQGSRVRQAKNEPAQPSGLDRMLLVKTLLKCGSPVMLWGKIIPKNVVQHGSEKHVVHAKG